MQMSHLKSRVTYQHPSQLIPAFLSSIYIPCWQIIMHTYCFKTETNFLTASAILLMWLSELCHRCSWRMQLIVAIALGGNFGVLTMNIVNSIVRIPIKVQWPANIDNSQNHCQRPNAVQYNREIDQSAAASIRVELMIKYNTTQYNTINFNAVPYNTIQCNTIQHNSIQYNAVQQNRIEQNTF